MKYNTLSPQQLDKETWGKLIQVETEGECLICREKTNIRHVNVVTTFMCSSECDAVWDDYYVKHLEQ